MRKIGLSWMATLVILAGCSGGGGGSADPASPDGGTGGGSPQKEAAAKKVMVVVLENTDAAQALQQPFMKQLVQKGALLSNYVGITHPSEPNYFAMTSGSTWSVRDDNTYTLDVRHVADLIDERGLTWKSYAEGYPGNCDLRADIGNYARKHEPFISYKNVQSDPARCARIVNASQFTQDLSAGNLPNFSFYVPDILNDGHDTGVAYADSWLSKTFGNLINDPSFLKDTLFVVTFDEGDQGEEVYTVVVGDSVVPGSSSAQSYNHYSLLRTIEDFLSLGTLGQGDATAQPFSGIWK